MLCSCVVLVDLVLLGALLLVLLFTTLFVSHYDLNVLSIHVKDRLPNKRFGQGGGYLG